MCTRFIFPRAAVGTCEACKDLKMKTSVFWVSDELDLKCHHMEDAVVHDKSVSAVSDGDKVHHVLELYTVPVSATRADDRVGKFLAGQSLNEQNILTLKLNLTVSQIWKVPHPLRLVNTDQKDIVVESIQTHVSDYTGGMLIVTLKDAKARYPAECRALFEAADGIRVLAWALTVSVSEIL